MNCKNALHAAVAALLVSLPAVSQTKTPVREERVLAFIHQANVFEIEAAKLALANSSSDAVSSRSCATCGTPHSTAGTPAR